MTEKKQVAGEGTPSAARSLWVYGYELIPPHEEHRMTAIRGLLEQENDQAKQEARTWTARLVTERMATHVLVVSASPELDLAANRHLESQLRALGIGFHVTVPMTVGSDTDGAEA